MAMTFIPFMLELSVLFYIIPNSFNSVKYKTGGFGIFFDFLSMPEADIAGAIAYCNYAEKILQFCYQIEFRVRTPK